MTFAPLHFQDKCCAFDSATLFWRLISLLKGSWVTLCIDSRSKWDKFLFVRTLYPELFKLNMWKKIIIFFWRFSWIWLHFCAAVWLCVTQWIYKSRCLHRVDLESSEFFVNASWKQCSSVEDRGRKCTYKHFCIVKSQYSCTKHATIVMQFYTRPTRVSSSSGGGAVRPVRSQWLVNMILKPSF